jgi:hypothetical protein
MAIPPIKPNERGAGTFDKLRVQQQVDALALPDIVHWLGRPSQDGWARGSIRIHTPHASLVGISDAHRPPADPDQHNDCQLAHKASTTTDPPTLPSHITGAFIATPDKSIVVEVTFRMLTYHFMFTP